MSTAGRDQSCLSIISSTNPPAQPIILLISSHYLARPAPLNYTSYSWSTFVCLIATSPPLDGMEWVDI